MSKDDDDMICVWPWPSGVKSKKGKKMKRRGEVVPPNIERKLDRWSHEPVSVAILRFISIWQLISLLFHLTNPLLMCPFSVILSFYYYVYHLWFITKLKISCTWNDLHYMRNSAIHKGKNNGKFIKMAIKLLCFSTLILQSFFYHN